LIDAVQARLTRAVDGSPVAGWFNYQPLWDMIVKEQPDLLN
jgi:hypothetical protein